MFLIDPATQLQRPRIMAQLAGVAEGGGCEGGEPGVQSSEPLSQPLRLFQHRPQAASARQHLNTRSMGKDPMRVHAARRWHGGADGESERLAGEAHLGDGDQPGRGGAQGAAREGAPRRS